MRDEVMDVEEEDSKYEGGSSEDEKAEEVKQKSNNRDEF